MRLSIAVVNWNTSNQLAGLIRSIIHYAPPFEYEIIVVDNASDDFDELLFNEEFPEVKLIPNRENLGYAKGNNQALMAAIGDYLLLMNPDTQVTDNAIEALTGFMESHPEAGAAGAKLVRPDGSLDRSVRSFPYPRAIACEFLGLSKLFPRSRFFGLYRMTYFAYDQVAEVDQPMGSCLIISRKALDEIGMLDEQFPIFFNEVDWLYRAKQAGYKVFFVPDAVVIHEGGAGTKQAGRRPMIRESHDSLVKFYQKHFKKLLPRPVYICIIACIKLGEFFRSIF